MIPTLRVIRAMALLALVACSGESAPSRSPAVVASPARAPDLAALRRLLAQHDAVRFDAAAQERGCPADQTLGEYVAMLAHNGESGDAPGDIHRLTGGCVEVPDAASRMAVDPPVDAAYWSCRIDAYTSDPAGASPWHYELRLRVRRADNAPDLRTMACPGAP